MSFLTQKMNQFTQTPILGAFDLIPSPNVVAVQLSPSSTAVCQVGSNLKLITGPSGLPMVDVCTGPTDGPGCKMSSCGPRPLICARRANAGRRCDGS